MNFIFYILLRLLYLPFFWIGIPSYKNWIALFSPEEKQKQIGYEKDLIVGTLNTNNHETVILFGQWNDGVPE